MRKTKKRLLSALLIGAMFVSMFPTGAFAETAETTEPSETTPTEQTPAPSEPPAPETTPAVDSSESSADVTGRTPAATNSIEPQSNGDIEPQANTTGSVVIKETGLKYDSIADALRAVQSGQTITLLQDIPGANIQVTSKTVTLNLNSHTLTLSSGITVNGAGAALTITGGTYNCNGTAAFTIESGASLTINGGTYNVTTTAVANNGGSLTITGGTFNKAVDDYVDDSFYRVVNGNTYSYYSTWANALAAATNGSTIGRADGNATAYTVNFNANGGTVSPESLQVYAGTTIYLPVPERNNYTFEGWQATSTYQAGEPIVVNSAISFTAQWTGDDCVITYDSYDKYGQQDMTATVSVEQGETITIVEDSGKRTETINGPYTLELSHKNDCIPLGWDYTEKNGNVTFTARYAENVTLDPAKVGATNDSGITVDVDGSEGWKASQSSFFDVSSNSDKQAIITAKEDLKKGEYSDVITFTRDGSFVKAYKVSLSVGDGTLSGSFPDSSVTLTVGGTSNNAVTGLIPGATVSYKSSNKAVASVKQGVITANKAGTATITATIKADGYETRKVKCNVTVVEPKKVTLTYWGANNGKGSTVSVPVDQEVTFKLNEGTVGAHDANFTDKFSADTKLQDAEKEGYTVQGWQYNGKTYTFTAKFTVNKYTVSFNANGGKMTINGQKKNTWSKTLNYGAKLSVPEPTRTGWKFAGWTLADGTPAPTFTEYAGETLAYTFPQNYELVATWTQNDYDVTFHINGNEYTRENVAHGSTIDSVDLNGKLGQYETVTDWYTDKDCTKGNEWDITKDPVVSDMDLYAKVDAVKYGVTYLGYNNGNPKEKTEEFAYGTTVTVNLNGGTWDYEPFNETDSSITINGNCNITDESTYPTKAGYTFMGWRYSKNADKGTYTLTAKWSDPDTYTLAFDANKGTLAEGTDNEVKVAYQGEFDVPQVSRVGYTFQGWQNANGDVVIPAGETTFTWQWPTSETLTAKWQKITYNVVFNVNGTETSSVQTVKIGNTIDAPKLKDLDGLADGSDIIKWTLNDEEWNFEKDTLTADVLQNVQGNTLVFTATTKLKTYDWTYKDAESGLNKTMTVKYGEHYVIDYADGKTALIQGQVGVDYTLPTLENHDGQSYTGWTVSCTGTADDPYRFTAQWSVDQHVWTYANTDGYKSEQTLPYGAVVLVEPNGGSFKVNDNAEPSTEIAQLTVDSDWTVPAPEERTGYTFTGWTFTAGEGTIASPHRLTANWEAGTYTITYNAGAGEFANGGSTTTKQVTIGQLADIPTPTREGYTFVGWNTEDSKRFFDAGLTSTTWNWTGDFMLNAQWQRNSVTVTYKECKGLDNQTEDFLYDQLITIDPKGGSITIDGETHTDKFLYNLTGDVTLPAPTLAGSNFTGWTFDEMTGTFTAHWDEITYTITYHGMGGTVWDSEENAEVDTYTQIITDAKDQTFDMNKFQRTGYVFTGWTLKENGSGSLLPDGKDIEKPRDMDLYAQWEEAQYVLSFDANEGDLPEGVDTRWPVAYGQTLTLPEVTRDGYTLTGWLATNDEGNTTLYQPGEPFTYNWARSINLQAQWTANLFDVQFDEYNESTGSMSNTSKKLGYDTEITVNPNGGVFEDSERNTTLTVYGDMEISQATREGYVFTGWRYEATAPGKVTLTATWTIEKFTITYYGNGGQAEAENGEKVDSYTQEISSAEGQKFIPNNFERDGYTFTGWKINNKGSLLEDEKDIRLPRDMKLYAQWEANTYTLTFDANGGEGGWSGEVTYGQDVYVPTPTKEGATFAGWMYNDNLSTVFVAGSVITYDKTQDMTLVAKWVTNVYNIGYSKYQGADKQPAAASEAFNHGTTIVVNPNGGTYKGSADEQSITVDGSFMTIEKPERTGYTFNGWYFSGDGTKEKPYTFKASWLENTFTVSLNANGGDFADESDDIKEVTVSENDNQLNKDELVQPTRVGYAFDGWYTDKACTTPYDFSSEVTSGITLYAGWAINSYTYGYTGYNEGADPTKKTTTLIHGTTITVDPNGGKYTDNGSYEEFEYTVTQDNLELKDPEAPVGKTFNGWRYDESNHSFMAEWKTAEYTITLHGNGGVRSNNATTYEVTADHSNVVDLADYQTIFTRDGAYELLGWSTVANGELKYAANAKTEAISADTDLYAVWAEVADFGKIAYGTVEHKSYNFGSKIGEVQSGGVFTCSQVGSDFTVSTKADMALGKYSDTITVPTAKNGFHYILASVTITTGETTVSIADKKDYYVAEDTIQVEVTSAPGQNLTLSLTGNQSGALEEAATLTEDKKHPGHYWASYTVKKIPADTLDLTFTVTNDKDKELATSEETIALRTIIQLTVTDSEGSVDIKEISLRDANDVSSTARALNFTKTGDNTYITHADKSGWDFIRVITEDGRTIDLYNTTLTNGQTINSALKTDTGIVYVEYAFSGYQVIGQLYVNGVKVDYPPFTITGNYAKEIGWNELTQKAEQYVKERYSEADPGQYGTTVTLASDNSDATVLKTYGDSDIVWGSNNEIYVNINIKAAYAVNFDDNVAKDGQVENMPESPQYVAHGGAVAEPTTDPIRTGYVFGGWYTDAECTNAYDFGKAVIAPFTLYAKWEKEQYTVEFNNGYGGLYATDTPWAPQTVAFNGKATEPTEYPTREGYTFQGWVTEPDGTTYWDFDENKVKGNMTLYAKWTQNEYTISFDTNLPEGTSVTNPEGTFSPVTLKHGDTYDGPKDPVVDGYVFQGWYVDGQKVEFPLTVTSNVKLVAQWAKAITIYYMVATNDEGTKFEKYETVTIAEGAKLTMPEAPTREGYVFDGWYVDSKATTEWNFDTPVTASSPIINPSEDGEPIVGDLFACWKSLEGVGNFFDTTATSTYVRIQFDDGNGHAIPATGITNLKVNARDKNGKDIFTNQTMSEIKPGDAEWQTDWSEDYAYYYGTYSSLAGKSGTLYLTAEGYTFNSVN